MRTRPDAPKVTTAPYGAWPSPLTAARVAAAGTGLEGVTVDGQDVLWLERRPAEGGRQVVVRRTPDGVVRDLLPGGWSARSRVHEYGGGDYLARDGVVWFSEFSDQGLYRLDPGRAPRRIAGGAATRYADGDLTPDGRWVVCVRETVEGDQPRSEVVAVPAGGGGGVRVLASGRDFVAAPRVSPDGRWLAWIAWDLPAMPWQGTELLVAALDDGAAGTPRTVAGGAGESVLEPRWTPAGELLCASDRTGWWNLYRWDPRPAGGAETSGDDAPDTAGDDAPDTAGPPEGGLQPLHHHQVELVRPPWTLGGHHYEALPGGRVVVRWFSGGVDHLGVLDAGGHLTELPCPYTAIDEVHSAGEAVVVAAAGPARLPEVALLDPAGGAPRVLARAGTLPLEEEAVSRAEAFSFATGGGVRAHALYHPPCNPAVAAPPGELPPLVVSAHGGPTGHRRGALDLHVQYLTTRGFGVVEVNYRGSTGYGRPYRQALAGLWGLADVEDCAAAVRALARDGRIDPGRVVIRGGSAGGYTALAAVTAREEFAAGVSYFGIADLRRLEDETHRFESGYVEWLVPPNLYEERSPVHQLDRLSTPLLILQGLEDPVVPPAQAEAVVSALDARGIPHAYLAFAGERHGFRRAETVEAALEAELSFYGQVLGFTPPGVPPLEVRHL